MTSRSKVLAVYFFSSGFKWSLKRSGNWVKGVTRHVVACTKVKSDIMHAPASITGCIGNCSGVQGGLNSEKEDKFPPPQGFMQHMLA